MKKVDYLAICIGTFVVTMVVSLFVGLAAAGIWNVFIADSLGLPKTDPMTMFWIFLLFRILHAGLSMLDNLDDVIEKYKDNVTKEKE